jgi:DNA-binding beta-propeller fold protein YncE
MPRRHLRLVQCLLPLALATACDGNSGPGTNYTHPAVAVVTSVPAGAAPYGVAISKAGEAWVSGLAGTVVIDNALPVDSFTVGNPIVLGTEAPHIVFNPAGTRAYVTKQSGQGMAVIAVANRTVITTVPLGHDGFNLITSRNGSQIFVSTDVGFVYTVSASTNQITDTIQLGPAVNGFARHPRLDRIYISSRDGGTVSEVDVPSHAVLRTFNTGGAPQRLAVSPDGSELLVANENNGLEIWKLATGLRDTTLLATAYGLGLSPDGEKAYVTSGPGGLITIVDRIGRSVDTVLTVGGTTRNVAFDRTGQAAVITNEGGFVTVVQ